MKAMAHLTNEEHVFIVTCYTRIKNAQTVQREFENRSNRRATLKTIYKNVNKYKRFGTSLNLNKGGTRRTRFYYVFISFIISLFFIYS